MMHRPQRNSSSGDDSTPAPPFDSILSDFDLYLFGQGKHYHIYDKMGAHVRTMGGVTGTHFAVWAPNARSVSVIGDFNDWNRSANPMHHNSLVVI